MNAKRGFTAMVDSRRIMGQVLVVFFIAAILIAVVGLFVPFFFGVASLIQHMAHPQRLFCGSHYAQRRAYYYGNDSPATIRFNPPYVPHYCHRVARFGRSGVTRCGGRCSCFGMEAWRGIRVAVITRNESL